MQRMDHAATARYGMPVFLLMENAGRAVAEAARKAAQGSALGAQTAKNLRSPQPRAPSVIVLCGGGHNGGDGVVAARYLRGWGYDAQVWWLKNPQRWEGDAALHYRIAKRFGVPFAAFSRIPPRQRIRRLRQAGVIVDALLGTGTSGEIRGLYREAIACINEAKRPTRGEARHRRPVVAVDIPSGLDADKGTPLGIAVIANVTVTMAAAKKGLLKPAARPYVGKLVIADIGFPKNLLPLPRGEGAG